MKGLTKTLKEDKSSYNSCLKSKVIKEMMPSFQRFAVWKGKPRWRTAVQGWRGVGLLSCCNCTLSYEGNLWWGGGRRERTGLVINFQVLPKWNWGEDVTHTHIHTPATARDKCVGEVNAETSSSELTENHAAVQTCMTILISYGGLPLYFLQFVLIS